MTATPSGDRRQEQSLGSLWRRAGLLRKTTLAVACLMAVYHLLFVSGIFGHLGIFISLAAHRALSLGFMLSIIFLTSPARAGRKSGQRTKLPWYDVVLLLMGLASVGYIFVFFDLAQTHLTYGTATTTEIVLFFLLLLSSLEAARRLIGPALPIVALFFVAHALFTDYFPGILAGKSFSLIRLTNCWYLGQEGIFGLAMGVASTVVVTFIIFAELLRATGAAETFLNLAMSLMGKWRGGPAKICVVGSALFATISGSPSANAAAIGSITIPLMKSAGYRSYFAAAVEAVSSKAGQITPPVMGAVAFIMAGITGLGYVAVCVAAALPALLYFIAVFFQVDFEAARTGLKGLPPSQIPPLKRAMKQGWRHLLPLLALIVLMLQLKYNPEISAVYSMLVISIVSSLSRETRLSPAKLLVTFEDAAKSICIAGIACALAGVVLGSLMGTGLGVSFSAQLLRLSGGNLFLLLMLTAVACYILGMGISSVAIYVILAAMVAPALTKMGVTVQGAHLFVIYWGNVAFISPPVATAAFVAAGIAGADPMKTGWQAVRLAIVSFTVPFIFVYDPSLLLMGTPFHVTLTVIRSIAAVIMLAAGLEGYLLRPVNWTERIVLLAAGLLLLLPNWLMSVAGVAAAVPVVIHQKRIARSTAQAATADESMAAGQDKST